MYINSHHLTYCTNIHSGESWDEVFADLKQYIPELKARLSPTAPFGIGLRLSNLASEQLILDVTLGEFKAWLQQSDCYVFTMNGFPYGGFHGLSVKDQVHAPDWRTIQRVEYTKRLIKILAELLPSGLEGGISISPISYKPWLDVEDYASVLTTATTHLIDLVKVLHQIKKATGKLIHLDLEPEPDGLIENSSEAIAFFNEHLLTEGADLFARSHSTDIDAAQVIILDHLQICYDVCHFSLAYETPRQVITDLTIHKIKVGKVQISAALKASIPLDLEGRQKLSNALSPFAESTYLHQVLGKNASPYLSQYRDLPEALLALPSTTDTEWKTHFHVPIFLAQYGVLESTQSDIVEVLQLLKESSFTKHLEIETYTWEVLPEAIKFSLADSIVREYEWVVRQL